MAYYNTKPKQREKVVNLFKTLGFRTKLVNSYRIRLEKNDYITYYTFVKQHYFDEYNKHLGSGLYNLLKLYNINLRNLYGNI